MNLIESLKRVLLKEAISRDAVIDAIRNRKVVTIYYAGDQTINKGYREIEAVAIGPHNKSGNVVVRAWQVRGSSDTPENRPGWRLFRLDKINSLSPTTETFETARPYFNPNGDKHMSQIFELAKFD